MESLHFSLLLPLITSFLLVLIKNLWFRRNTRASKLPPGPWKLPIVGNLHHLVGEHPHRRLRSLAQKYGPLFHLKLGEVDLMVISSPKLAGECMKTHDMCFASRPQIMGSRIIMYNSSDIVFSPCGKVWAQLRRICAIELFNAKRVKHFRSLMAEESDNLVAKIRMAGGSPVNLTAMLAYVANITTSRATFGMECNQQGKIFAAVRDTFQYMSGFDLADLFPSFSFLGEINGVRRHLEKAHQVLDAALDEIFEQHQTKNTSRDDEDEDLVDVLLRLKKTGELDASVTSDNLKGVIIDMILGGTESPSNIMEWTMAEIIRHPQVMRRVQLEVRNAFNGKTKIHEHEVTNLPYLNMAIKESLRVRPSAPFLVPRYCTETVDLGGYTIPVGSRVLINAWAIMRDPSCWDDAESFKPERVEADEQDFCASRFQYLPFGGGRRICPAAAFGMAIVEIVLANLLHHFDWELPGGGRPEELDMEETIGLGLTRKNPLFLVAKPHT